MFSQLFPVFISVAPCGKNSKLGHCLIKILQEKLYISFTFYVIVLFSICFWLNTIPRWKWCLDPGHAWTFLLKQDPLGKIFFSLFARFYFTNGWSLPRNDSVTNWLFLWRSRKQKMFSWLWTSTVYWAAGQCHPSWKCNTYDS